MRFDLLDPRSLAVDAHLAGESPRLDGSVRLPPRRPRHLHGALEPRVSLWQGDRTLDARAPRIVDLVHAEPQLRGALLADAAQADAIG